MGCARPDRPLVSPPPARPRRLGAIERFPAPAGLLHPLALAADAAGDARASFVDQMAQAEMIADLDDPPCVPAAPEAARSAHAGTHLRSVRTEEHTPELKAQMRIS